MIVYLLLGANLGNRKKNLDRAVAELNKLPHTRVLRRSRRYETAPVGKSGGPFLNIALKLRTKLSPMGLLVEAKRLESQAGRRPGPRWKPRPLDIDILFYGDKKIKTSWLAIPHPLLTRRAFVLAPLSELIPGFSPLLKRLNPGPGTVKIYHGS